MSSTLLSSIREHKKNVHGACHPVVHGKVMSAVEEREMGAVGRVTVLNRVVQEGLMER